MTRTAVHTGRMVAPWDRCMTVLPHIVPEHYEGQERRKSSGNTPGAFPGRPADPMAYRRLFRDRWGTFLRHNFRNHIEVAFFFSTDEKTARQWWNYVNQPQGWAVDYAYQAIPGAAQALRMAA